MITRQQLMEPILEVEHRFDRCGKCGEPSVDQGNTKIRLINPLLQPGRWDPHGPTAAQLEYSAQLRLAHKNPVTWRIAANFDSRSHSAPDKPGPSAGAKMLGIAEWR